MLDSADICELSAVVEDLRHGGQDVVVNEDKDRWGSSRFCRWMGCLRIGA